MTGTGRGARWGAPAGVKGVLTRCWLRSVDWFNLSDSYHATASGESDAYYPVFSHAA